MQLSRWLAMTNTRPAAFARSVGVTRACMSGYLLGKHKPSLWRQGLIADLTEGQVTAADWSAEPAEAAE